MFSSVSPEEVKWYHIALSKRQITRSVVTSIVVGSILTFVNQSEALMSGAVFDWGKAVTTYVVPFCVSMYSSTSALLSSIRRQ